MLKITHNNEGGITTLKLEGKLTGEWVSELQQYWQQTLLTNTAAAIRIDLAAVAWVSDEGKVLLGTLQQHGAELLAANLLMVGIVAELSAETTE